MTFQLECDNSKPPVGVPIVTVRKSVATQSVDVGSTGDYYKIIFFGGRGVFALSLPKVVAVVMARQVALAEMLFRINRDVE